MYDLVIRGGTVVDGTGAPARTADVAVRDGRIVEVGRVDGAARRVVDADGLLVTPGFVDVHTHYDGQATWDPHLTPSCWHGVTTVVLGNCGVGFAPAAPDKHDWLIGLMEGVEDIPGSALAEGIQWDWESFPEYLDALERMPRAIDIGAQVPHGAVRAYVMGERGAGDALATADDVQAMVAVVREAMDAGALGFSTGRTAGHKAIDGTPVPGTFAADDEVLALGGALADAGHGVFQLVPAGTGGEYAGDAKDASERELDLMLRVGRATGRPVTFLVMQSTIDPDSWRPRFEAVHRAREDGVLIYPQVATRCFGMLVGHQSRANPFRARPTYQAMADLPLEARVARLRDPEVRRRLLAEAPDASVPGAMVGLLTPNMYERLFVMGDPPDYEPTADMSVAAQARREGRQPEELAYDLMLGDDGRELLLFPLLNYGNFSYDGLHDMLVDPTTVQGLGDGGAHCGTVCDASMTTFMLTHWVRDRTRGPRLPLEHAVRRLTLDSAALYGLHDRGVIAPGRKADLNLIDFERLSLPRPTMVQDLPAGASRMLQRSEGFVATLLSGEVVVDNGEITEVLPGRLLRGGRESA